MGRIEEAVDSLFVNDVVYAIPGTQNHAANFYGDRNVCELTRQDVIGCIKCARDSWNWPEDSDAERLAIETVLRDLQINKPL